MLSTKNAAPPEQNAIGVRDEGQEIDALLCSLHRVTTTLHDDVEATRRTSTARASHIVDFSQFEARARQIATLRHLHTELQKLTTVVAQHGQAADTLHQEELASMQEYIDMTCRLDPRAAARRGRSPPRAAAPARTPSADRGVPWKDEALTARVLGRALRGRAAAEPARGASVWAAPPREPRTPSVSTLVPATAAYPRRKIVLDDLVSLDAVIIPDAIADPREILAAVTTPELYYIPRWDHFAVRCGAVVFHGNVGQVYPTYSGRSQRAPVRVKECRHRGACPSLARGDKKAAPCAYYHDPEECPGSKDVRNHIADSWVYAPVTTRYSARYGSRRLGSRDALKSDLQEISAGDARRHVAQTAHDILCSIILAKYVLAAGAVTRDR